MSKICQCHKEKIIQYIAAAKEEDTHEASDELEEMLKECICQESKSKTSDTVDTVGRLLKQCPTCYMKYSTKTDDSDYQEEQELSESVLKELSDFTKVICNSLGSPIDSLKEKGKRLKVLAKLVDRKAETYQKCSCSFQTYIGGVLTTIHRWPGCEIGRKEQLKSECDHIVGYQSDEDDWGKTYQRPVRLSFIEYFSQKDVYLDVSLNYCDDCGKKITFDWSTINAPLKE